MARETLPVALTLMFGHEGGYVNNPSDPGGPTRYGITAKTLGAHRRLGRSATAAEVKKLTLAEAEEIYRQSYWGQSGGDLLPVGLDYAAFDFGVNSGPGTAVRHLQKVVGVTQDGIVGAQTVAACQRYGSLPDLIRAYCDERMTYLHGLSTWRKFGRGWTRRVTGKDPKGQYATEPGVVGNALKLAAGKKSTPVAAKPVGNEKAPPASTSVTEIIKKEPSLVVSAITAVGAFAAGSGPVQWALAACLVAAVGYGLYRLVKRERGG